MRGVYGIVYKADVIYVGQSIDMRRRFAQHRNKLQSGAHRNFILQRIHDKHPDALDFIVLAEVADLSVELWAVEQDWMDDLQPAANLSSARGSHEHTAEARAKMSAYARQRPASHLAAMSQAALGREPATKGKSGIYRHSDETKAKIASAGRGRVVSDEERARRSASQKGRVFSEEHREKLRLAKLGKPNEAVRKAMTGRKQSPEIVAKRVEATRATVAARKGSDDVRSALLRRGRIADAAEQ